MEDTFLQTSFANGNAVFPSSILQLGARTGCTTGREQEEGALGEALAAAAPATATAARFNEHKRAHAKLYKYRQV